MLKLIPPSMSKLLVDLARSVTKLKEDSEFDDWRDKDRITNKNANSLMSFSALVKLSSFVKR